MADTVQITAGSGITVSTDELNIDGVLQQVQRVKIGLGANNAWNMDLTSGQQTMTNSIPVAIASNQTAVQVYQTLGMYNEDSNHTSGDIGHFVLSVSNAVASGLANASGDYQPLMTSSTSGRLYTSAAIDTALPTGSNAIGKLAANDGVDIGDVTINNATGSAVFVQPGTGATWGLAAGSNAIGKLSANSGVIIGDVNIVSLIPGSGITSLGKAEDQPALSGDVGVAVYAVRRDSPSSDVSAAGDYATLQVNSTGSLWTVDTATILDNAGFTDGTTPISMAGFIFDETAGTALTENDGAAARVDSKRAQVHVIEDATTRGQRATVTTRGSQYLEGPVAHHVAYSANPVTVGGYAVSAEASGIVNGEVVRFVADITGKQIMMPFANPENFISGVTASGIVDTNNRQIIAAQATGVRSYITSILVTNASSSVGTVVNIKDGSTTVYSGYAAANGGGFSAQLSPPLRLSAATAVNAACVTTAANVWVSLVGYKGV